MSGRGVPPKRPQDRARTNADPVAVRTLGSEIAPPPELPPTTPDGDPWPEQTLIWWGHWIVDPLTSEFRTSDWDELLATACLHAKFWQGDYKVAAELRQRTAKFGATPEDRLRLRIQFVAAEEADDKSARRRAAVDQPVAGTYSSLRAVGQ